MQVMHIVATGQRRGAETFAADLISATNHLEISQSVVVLRAGDEPNITFAVPSQTLSSATRTPRLRVDVGAIRDLRKLVAKQRPDVVLAHGGEPLRYALAAARERTSIVYRRIGSTTARPNGVVRSRLHTAAMRRADRVVTVAHSLRSEIIANFAVDPDRIVVIPNAVDGKRLVSQRPRSNVRNDLGIEQDAVVILSLGALTWEKDPLAALRATSSLSTPGIRVHHLFAGDGPLRGRLESALASESAGRVVHLLGSRQDVGDLLGASDVLLLASRTEGMPACLIEAGLAGLPAVAFGIAGVPEVLVPGVSGSLIPPGDVSALAGGVQELILDPMLRKRMGRAARARCAAFDIRAISERYLELYRNLVA